MRKPSVMRAIRAGGVAQRGRIIIPACFLGSDASWGETAMAETVVVPPETPAGTDVLDQKRLLAALRRVRNGDFKARLPLDGTGVAGEIAQAFNDVVDLNERMAREFARISVVVGREGRVGQRAALGPVTGAWADCVASVNTLIDDLSKPTGEILQLKDTINTMVDQLNAFASEVTRVAREVGTEGKLGGQADVRGVAGTW